MVVNIPPPPPIPPGVRTEESKRAEVLSLGGPTLFANRFAIVVYPDGGVRITFAEQFSPDQTIPPAFRTAAYLPRTDAEFLLGYLADQMGFEVVRRPPNVGLR